MGQSRPLFNFIFRSFLITISIQIEKSVDGVLGIRTRVPIFVSYINLSIANSKEKTKIMTEETGNGSIVRAKKSLKLFWQVLALSNT